MQVVLYNGRKVVVDSSSSSSSSNSSSSYLDILKWQF